MVWHFAAIIFGSLVFDVLGSRSLGGFQLVYRILAKPLLQEQQRKELADTSAGWSSFPPTSVATDREHTL